MSEDKKRSPLSFGHMAIGVGGAAVAVLVLTAILIWVLPLPPEGLAIVALLGVAGAIGAMAYASNRLTARVIAEMDDDELH